MGSVILVNVVFSQLCVCDDVFSAGSAIERPEDHHENITLENGLGENERETQDRVVPATKITKPQSDSATSYCVRLVGKVITNPKGMSNDLSGKTCCGHPRRRVFGR